MISWFDVPRLRDQSLALRDLGVEHRIVAQLYPLECVHHERRRNGVVFKWADVLHQPLRTLENLWDFPGPFIEAQAHWIIIALSRSGPSLWIRPVVATSPLW